MEQKQSLEIISQKKVDRSDSDGIAGQHSSSAELSVQDSP